MIASRSGPLLVLVFAIAGWVVLRSMFLALSAPPPMSPELIIADREPTGPAWPFVLPGRPALSPPFPAAELRGEVATSTRPAAALALAPRHDQRRSLFPMAPVQAERSPIIAAQSLLLARMLSHRGPLERPAALGAPALVRPTELPGLMPSRRAPDGHWSLAAALHVRRGEGAPALGSGAVLGGTQAWARLGWQPRRDAPELFVRTTSAGRFGRGAEAAFGVAVRPSSRVPVELVAERRQRVAGEGRSAFALYAVGGANTERAGWQIDSYGAAGIVGTQRRDLFAEGAVTIARPVARLGPFDLSAGAGAWGAAQPGASRLDLGPTLSARSARLEGARLAVDWRQRVTGDAAPASGPAVTLSVGF